MDAVAQYAQFEALSDGELKRVRALADYTLFARHRDEVPIQEMTLEQLVAVRDAARTLLLTEQDTGVRNAFLDTINAAEFEALRRSTPVAGVRRPAA